MWATLRDVTTRASTEDRVRAFLALLLVGVLISLVFVEPVKSASPAAAASAKTLAIAVIAFYFGLHKGTPAATETESRTLRRRNTTLRHEHESPPDEGGRDQGDAGF